MKVSYASIDTNDLIKECVTPEAMPHKSNLVAGMIGLNTLLVFTYAFKIN
jgi:hypothetical protein